MNKARASFAVAAAGLTGIIFAASQAGLFQTRGAAAGQTRVEQAEEAGALKESPLACDLAAFTPEQLRHKEELGARLWAAVQESKELPDGYAFRLPSDGAALQTVGEWVAMERVCCPFFSFGVEAEREGGPVWLRLTGREGVKGFIRSEFQRGVGAGHTPTGG